MTDVDPTPERRMLTALFRLQLAQRQVTAVLGQQSGLSESDLVALGLLTGRPPVPVKDLAVDLGLNPGSTSTLVDRLARAGMVHRAQSASDRRVQLVGISDAGAAVITSAREKYIAAIDAARDTVTEQCLVTASSVMAVLSAHLMADAAEGQR